MQTPPLHDHNAQVLQEAASALRSLHDGNSSNGSSQPTSKRTSVAGGNTSIAAEASSTAGHALQAAVEAASASTVNNNNNKATTFDEEIPLTFPQRLMELLDDEANDDIIGWLPHGRGFLIYQKRRFAAEIMPKYFKQSKFTSFTRKLNRWGFTRISRGPETGAYYHPHFRRGNVRLCLQMTCQSLKCAPGASNGPAGVGATSTEMPGAEVTNAAPPSMLRHQEAATAQPAAPKASRVQQQQGLPPQPIGPAPGLPNLSTAAAGSPSAELLFTETATQSVLRLRRLQKQQELLMVRQRQIRKEIQAISAALPGKIERERRQQQTVAAVAAVATTPSASPAALTTPPFGHTQAGKEYDPAYNSAAIVDAAVEALKRSNANSYRYLTLLKARQQQQQQRQQAGAKPAPPAGTVSRAHAASGLLAPAPTMATFTATPATNAATSTPADFQSQLRQNVRAQINQMRLAQSQRLQQALQVQQLKEAQQTNQAMEGIITLTDDGRLKATPSAIHPAQAAARSGTYRSGSQHRKRPSGAKRASAA